MISTFLLAFIVSDGSNIGKPLIHEFPTMGECLTAGFAAQQMAGERLREPYVLVNSCLEGARAGRNAKAVLTYTILNGTGGVAVQIGLDSIEACYKFADHLTSSTFNPGNIKYYNAFCRNNEKGKK